MTSIVDSEAHLNQRAAEVGLTAASVAALGRHGFTTLGKLAFAHGQPGAQIDANQFHTFAGNTLGALMTLGDEAALKRLLFEGHTLVLSQLRESITNPEASHSRKLPQVERTAKMEALRARLVGVCIERQLDPSHALLDAASQQHESQQLVYLSPDKCSSREWEVQMAKTTKQIRLDSDKLTVKEDQQMPDQTASTEMQVFEALRRRGVALAFADLLSWQVHERYLSSLFNHLRREAPAGFSKVTLQQVLRADRAAWTRLIESCQPIRRNALGDLPLDTALIQSLESYEVGFNVVPLPKAPSLPPKNDTWDQWRNHRGQWHDRWRPYEDRKGKGKGKGKDKNAMLPKAFKNRDCTSVDPHGRRLCFGYNLGSCTQAPDGAACQRGWHLCMRKNCQAPHKEKDHDAATSGAAK